MEIILFILDITLVLASSVFLISLFKVRGRSEFLLGVYLLSFANIVLVSEVAGTIETMNSKIFFLGSHFLLAFGILLFWRKAGRPSLLGPLENLSNNLDMRTILRYGKLWPDLSVLCLAITGAYIVLIGVILSAPPSTYDSMTCHLSRVGYWLQQGSLKQWQTPNIFQTIYPINAQSQFFWTILFWGTDQLTGFVQWLCIPVGFVAIYGIGGMLGYTRPQALFAALLWASFPEILLQSTSTQNDLVASALFMCMIYLFYLGINSRRFSTLILSGLAMGLALGTKQTVFFMLPGLILLVVMLLLKYKKQFIKPFFVWVSASILAFLILGTYIYALNISRFGNPFGPASLVSSQGGTIYGSASRLEFITTNSLRFFYQFIDLTGLPDLVKVPLYNIKADGFRQLISFLGVPITSKSTIYNGYTFDLSYQSRLHEDNAWFGPLSFLLLTPAIIYHFFKGLVKREPLKLGLIFFVIGFVVIIAGFRGGWTPHQGRYFVLAVTTLAPLTAPILGRGFSRSFLRWTIVALALVVLADSLAFNPLKPIIKKAFWSADRVGRQTINNDKIRQELRMIDKLVPVNATVGTIVNDDDWDYPFFGEHFTRKVVPIFPYSNLSDFQWFAEQGIKYVIVNNSVVSSIRFPSWLYPIGQIQKRTVFYRGEANFSKWDDQLKINLLETDRMLSVRIDSSLAGLVGITEILPPEWGEEFGRTFVWLGHEEKQGVRVVLLSATEKKVVLSMEISAGPARNDSTRRIELKLENKIGVSQKQEQFTGSATVAFNVVLQPWRNEISLKDLDNPTIGALQSGDTRPLLALLKGITVRPYVELNNSKQ